MIWPDLTHQPTHPPTKPYTHPWVGKSPQISNLQQNWNISISLSAIGFWLIPGGPHWGGGVGGGGSGVVRGCPHICAHAHACTYDIIGNSQGFPQWGRPFAWNYHVYHAYMCVHAHACAHVWGHPNHPPSPSTHPQPQSCREPKTPKFNKSWTNQDNLILFEDSLPLNIPELI